ncbi:hypothetical protein E2C01_003457 [Portunus trituberculatus]|uniref:Uncharacterized protein n=1 Tax=Portunus trituberculatus TaxID=210409 RepID=A0A5B7CQ76_PORTR|nr:hypothetical protein [Portunus trituberculatus]
MEIKFNRGEPMSTADCEDKTWTTESTSKYTNKYKTGYCYDHLHDATIRPQLTRHSLSVSLRRHHAPTNTRLSMKSQTCYNQQLPFVGGHDLSTNRQKQEEAPGGGAARSFAEAQALLHWLLDLTCGVNKNADIKRKAGKHSVIQANTGCSGGSGEWSQRRSIMPAAVSRCPAPEDSEGHHNQYSAPAGKEDGGKKKTTFKLTLFLALPADWWLTREAGERGMVDVASIPGLAYG